MVSAEQCCYFNIGRPSRQSSVRELLRQSAHVAGPALDQVLLFHQFSPAAKVGSHATYVQVGNGQQRFLIKEIDSRPDFDHIVSYRAAASASTAPVLIAKNGMTERDAKALAAALNASPSALHGTVYFYTDD